MKLPETKPLQSASLDAERLLAELRQLETFKSRHAELGTRGEDEGEGGNDNDDIFSHDSTKGSPVEEVVDRDWIDIKVVKLWAETCDRRHGTHCRPRHANTATPPAWLIDVSVACLVRGAPDMVYVALSYIWGNAVGGQACKENLARLQQPKALLEDDMPRTIRDVIRLLPLIGERYLWVDRLCIVQDDEQHKAIHINRMASIYSNAHMTIVHAMGDGADYGLRGFAALGTASCIYSGGDHAYFDHSCNGSAHQLTRLSSLPNTKWYSRGWTLQELVFSRRLLVLTNSGAFWECHCHTVSASTTLTRARWVVNKCTKHLADIFRAQYFPPWPNLHMYLQLVSAYNTRDLTFDDDVLAAFAGITTSLSSSFEGGFLFGLPEVFLDVALLWRPLGPCRRRAASRRRGDGPATHKSALPSWSWIGWQMDIDPLSWKCGYDYIKSTRSISWPKSKYDTLVRTGCSWKLRSTVQWHVADGLDSPTRPVIPDYKRYQHDTRSSSSSSSLPSGWQRYSLPFEGPGMAEFAHSADSRTRFHFPIPLPSPDLKMELPDRSERHEQDGPFLYCKTDHAYLPTEEPRPGSIVASIQDSKGKWAGVVRMQVGKDKFQAAQGDDGEPRDLTTLSTEPRQIHETKLQDFIAVSEGSARNQWNERVFLEEWDLEERPRDTPLYEFINVLCVERGEDGIFYRLGVGRVLKATWEREKGTAIQVTLG